jgi:hypothetical protein
MIEIEITKLKGLTRQQAASKAGLTGRQIDRAIQSGKLKAVKLPRFVFQADLEAFQREFAPQQGAKNVRRQKEVK